VIHIFSFRPSSHSTYFTYITTFNRSESLKLAKKSLLKKVRRLMYDCSEINVETSKTRLLLCAYTTEGNHSLQKRLSRFFRALKDVSLLQFGYLISPYLKIEVTLPKGTSKEIVPILFSPEQFAIITSLSRYLKPIVIIKKDEVKLQFCFKSLKESFWLERMLYGRYCKIFIEMNEVANIDQRWRNWKTFIMPPKNARGFKVKPTTKKTKKQIR